MVVCFKSSPSDSTEHYGENQWHGSLWTSTGSLLNVVGIRGMILKVFSAAGWCMDLIGQEWNEGVGYT